MRIILLGISIILMPLFAAFNKKSKNLNDSGYKNNIKFNHLFVVIDDSTYKYLFDSLKFPVNFAKTNEQTVNSGSTFWTGKYIQGFNNYLEIFKPGSIKGGVLGSCGLGFTTNKYGTIDSLQNYWANKLDSVHIENETVTDSGKTSPWFKSVSIPDVDSLKISAWVFENSNEEMNFAGFTNNDLSKEIEYPDYVKHMSAKFRNIPIDSVKFDKLFNKITSLDIRLTGKELAYLQKFLIDIGFNQKNKSFSKDDFTITYSLSEAKHFLLKEIGISLFKKLPKQNYSFRKIEMIVNGDQAKMKFKY